MTDVNTIDMERMEQEGTAGCNTISSPPTRKKTRAWTLTINNPTKEEEQIIDNLFDDDKVVDLVGQYERGESGTLHIQLLINWKNPRSFGGVKKLFPRAHIEAVKNLIGTAKYCSKEDTREELLPSWEKIGSKALQKEWNMEQEQKEVSDKYVTDDCEDPLEGKTLRPWQEEILELYGTEPDDRKIYWYYDPIGGKGKTSLAKSLLMNYDDVLLCTGSVKDSKYVIAQWIMANKWKRSPRMIIYDIARCQDSERISYQALEDLKNGIFVSTKYESRNVVYKCPHMIVFSNQLPDEKKVSQDRWVIKYMEHMDGYETDSDIPMEWYSSPTGSTP